MLVGYVLLSVLLIGLGLILTKLLVGGPVGRWDNSVNRWFVTHRTTTLNTVTSVGSIMGASFTIVGIAVDRELLDVLTRPDADRGALIGRLSLRDDTAWVAELLIEIESDPDDLVNPRPMKITRIAVAIGSLMALVLAGGAHWKG